LYSSDTPVLSLKRIKLTKTAGATIALFHYRKIVLVDSWEIHPTTFGTVSITNGDTMKAIIFSLALLTINIALASEKNTQDNLFLRCRMQPTDEKGGPLYIDNKLVVIEGLTRGGSFPTHPTWKVLSSVIEVKDAKFFVYVSVSNKAAGGNFHVDVIDNPNQSDVQDVLNGNVKYETLHQTTTFGVPQKSFEQRIHIKGKKYLMNCSLKENLQEDESETEKSDSK